MASFSVVNNIASANAQANLATTNIGLQQALNRLSSGLRINRSGDDAAGLAVANAYRSNIAVLNQGMRNAGDALPSSDAAEYDAVAWNLARTCWIVSPRWPRSRPRRAQRSAARRWTSSSRTCSPKSTAKRRSRVSTLPAASRSS